jgi:excisionase family DNA binding protein
MATKQTTPSALPALLSTAQAAQLLGVHPNTIRNWEDQNLLQAYRIGPRRDRRFRREDLERFLGAQDGNGDTA